MGSYTSVMNDTGSDMYIKYAANDLALTVAAVVTGALGVVAAVVSGGVLLLAADAVAIGVGLGVGAGTLSLAALVGGSIAISANKAGYHTVPPGGVYRSEKLTLSLVHQADVLVALQVDDNTLELYSGSFTVWTGPTAGSDKRYNLSDHLGSLDHQTAKVSNIGQDSCEPVDDSNTAKIVAGIRKMGLCSRRLTELDGARRSLSIKSSLLELGKRLKLDRLTT
ncbi:hypothetical protein EXIGLDRAFT_707884 [Exidia glandulosa HHB12029]|uniref:Uncharacterized protein n=1 Tax=Exidia glandulosa HHB12029 TaxID=1314781 RepID=A0A166NDB2_EXIGL|nr:hypothetical protein EXIGLDRAFT_707884 [Exidia glandulosa HHB12029]